MPFHYRKYITRMRCGSSFLRIEVGRWEKLDREDRKCLVCVTGAVEDEKHFLLDCYIYGKDKEIMFQEIKDCTSRHWDFERMKKRRKWLMDALIGNNVGNDTDCRAIMMAVGKFLCKAYNRRKHCLGLGTEEAL